MDIEAEFLGPISLDSYQQGRVAGLREAVKQLHEGVRLAQSREVADALSGHAYTLDRIAQQAQEGEGVGDDSI
jgi:hypothetical protein